MDRKKLLLSLCFLVAVWAFFFHKGLFLDKRTLIWDAESEFFPSLWYTGHMWKNWILPPWNYLLFNGYPAFADPQNQTFYPLNIVISLIADFSSYVAYLQLVFHYLLAAVFMYLLAGLYVQNTAGRLAASLTYAYSSFLALSNVKYILSPDGSIEVLKDAQTLPRAFVVNRTLRASSPEAAFEMLSDPAVRSGAAAVTEAGEGLAKGPECDEKNRAVITEYRPNRVQVQTESACASLLVLSDTYYPGWKARVDGGPFRDVLVANYGFRGVELPAGRHEVSFELQSASFSRGLRITAASLVFAMAGVVFWLRRSRDKKG